jgi:hypothetical protein
MHHHPPAFNRRWRATPGNGTAAAARTSERPILLWPAPASGGSIAPQPVTCGARSEVNHITVHKERVDDDGPRRGRYRHGHAVSRSEHVAVDQHADHSSRQDHLGAREQASEWLEQVAAAHDDGKACRCNSTWHSDGDGDLQRGGAADHRRLVQLFADRRETADHDRGAERAPNVRVMPAPSLTLTATDLVRVRGRRSVTPKRPRGACPRFATGTQPEAAPAKPGADAHRHIGATVTRLCSGPRVLSLLRPHLAGKKPLA